MNSHDFETAPTAEYFPVTAPTMKLCSRDTDLDLTEPLHDPADEELTDPGLPSHKAASWLCRNDDGTDAPHKRSMRSFDLCDECLHAEREEEDNDPE